MNFPYFAFYFSVFYHQSLMKNRITLRILLEHIQASKNDLQQQIKGIEKRLFGLKTGFEGLEKRMERGFQESKLWDEKLRADLFETILLQAKHSRKLLK